jgi:hypothetical protein
LCGWRNIVLLKLCEELEHVSRKHVSEVKRVGEKVKGRM